MCLEKKEERYIRFSIKTEGYLVTIPKIETRAIRTWSNMSKGQFLFLMSSTTLNVGLLRNINLPTNKYYLLRASDFPTNFFCWGCSYIMRFNYQIQLNFVAKKIHSTMVFVCSWRSLWSVSWIFQDMFM